MPAISCSTANNKKMAHNFIYYLQADNDADEWFKNLPEKEKRSWRLIERLFRRRWLEEEEIWTTETVTTENEHHPTSSTLTTTSHSLGIGHPTCTDM